MGKRRIDEDRLLRVALEEFAENSYEEASVNRIIERAGITKGSFYYRYDNKYDLYIRLLREGNRLKWEHINGDGTVARGGGGDLFDLFKLQAESGIRFAAVHRPYALLARAFSREKGNPVYSRALADVGSRDEAGLRTLISRSYEAGLFRKEYSREFVEKTLTALFLSFDEIFFREDDYDPDEALSYLGDFTSFLKRGLGRPEVLERPE